MKNTTFYISLFFLISSYIYGQKKDKSIGQNLIILKSYSLKKSLTNIYEIYSVKKIETIFGKPLRIKKEQVVDTYGEEPWTIIIYNGLKIELTGYYISDITISNNDWSINTIKLSDSLTDISKKLKKIKKTKKNYILYEIPNFEGVFFVNTDLKGKVKSIGISLN